MSTKQHILVVEDERHLAVLVKYNLEHEGYRVTTMGDGPTALAFVAEHSDDIDLVVLDLMLPGMSGYAVCESLRAEGFDMPVLILSARTLSEDRTRGFDVGANQYLSKPFDLDELLSRVRNLLTHYPRRKLEAGSLSGPEIFAFDDAVVNFSTFEVTVRGEQQRLTQLELKLLNYFVQHEGRVIPRQELLEEVWDMPGHVVTRAVDQFIRRLRKTFEKDPANPEHFLTIRDAGYRFVSGNKKEPSPT
ncbi:MAG TPA: response regulator transcription factor [Pirellulaceae bacterium]|nr:response regulator transcription factor [Pirellulaceae bacterium]